MTFTKFMKATATVFCTVIVATFTACVDQDNSELRTPKSPDDPVIAPTKPEFTPNRVIDENGPEAIVDLTLKVDSGSFSDKGSMNVKFKTTVRRDLLQITMEQLEKTHKGLGLNVTNANAVTKVYSEDFAVNDGDTIQAKATAGMGTALGHEFSIIIDSIKVTKWENKTATNPTAIVAGAKRVDNVPTEVTYYCHEIGTHRANAEDAKFKVVNKVDYRTWIPEDGVEKIGDYAKNVKRSVKNFVDTQELDFVEIFKKGEETWETETHYINSFTFVVETITLEDLFASNFDLTKVVPAGISTGIEGEVQDDENGFSHQEKSDIYSASRTIGGSTQNTVYKMTNRKVFFKKGSVSLTFGYITPNVKEISDYMNTNNKSDKEGYDMQVFENVVEIAYGVDSTGVSRDRFSENGKVYVKKTVTPEEVTVKSVDVKVTVDVDLDALTETATAKGTITYSDNSTKTVDLTRTDNIKFDVNPAWTINGKEATQTTSDFGYKKTSSSAKTATVEGKDYTASWAYDAESWATTEKVTSNNVEKSNGTTLDLYNNYAITVEGHTFKASAITISAATSNDHLTKDSESGLTSTYYYVVNHTWSVGGQAKELHPSGTITVTADDYVITRRWYDIKDWDESPTTFYHIGQVTEWASGKQTKEEADLSFVNGLLVGQSWRSEEVDNTDTSYSPVLTENSRQDITKSYWKYQVVETGISIENQLAGSKQYDNYVATTIDGVEVTMNGETYVFPRRTVTATAQKSLVKVSDTEYSHSNVLTLVTGSSNSSSTLTGTAYGTIIVPATVIPQEKEWGAYLGYKACAALSADGNSTIVGITARFEKGSLPIAVKADGTVDFDKSRFEPGSFIYDGATYTDGGLLVNCYTSKDDNFGLLWYRGTNDVQKMKSFTDLTRMDFNWKHNVFAPQKYGELVENNNHFSIPGTNWSWDY